ncbi:MAG: AlpA family phage regulatory protein [Gammaproteobacteria bacterium]|nr:AlpA family phage regulatory protein [Gammaproteobacteria bacterium]
MALPKRNTEITPALLDKREVMKLTALSYTTLWRMSKVGQFPLALKLPTGGLRWRKSDVDEWIENLAAGQAG